MNKISHLGIFLTVVITMSLYGMEEPLAKKQRTEGEQKELNEQLWLSAENGDIEEAQRLIDEGADINALNGDYSTPLYNALQTTQNFDMARFLVDKGADVNKGTSDGAVPLHYLVGELEAEEEIEFYIKRGANVNAVDDKGCSVLHQAAGYGTSAAVELLIQYGANVNAVDKDGSSVLKEAVKDHDGEETIKTLLLEGAQLNKKDNEEIEVIDKIFEDHPLILAALRDDSEQISLLIKQKGSKDIEEALLYAVAQGRQRSILALLNCGASPKQALLTINKILQRYFAPGVKANYAVLKTQLVRRLTLKDQLIEKLKIELKEGRVNSKNILSLPVELQVEINPTQVLINAVASDDMYNASSALEHGANPQAINEEGESMLKVASAKKSVKMIALLLKFISSSEISKALMEINEFSLAKNKDDHKYVLLLVRSLIQELKERCDFEDNQQ
jgi:ankyrin repeat protein